MSRLISFAVLIGIIIIIGLLFYKVLIGFFVPVFLAAVLVVVFRPLHYWVLEKTGHRDWLAAGATTLLIMLLLALPIFVVGGSAAVQGLRLLKENNTSVLLLKWEEICNTLGIQMPEFMQQIEEAAVAVDDVATQTGKIGVTDSALNVYGDAAVAKLEKLRTKVQSLDDDDPLQPVDQWDEEFEEVIELARLVGHSSEQEPDASEEGEEVDQLEIIPARVAVELKSKFGNLKTDLLGGEFMSLAREYANLSDSSTVSTLRNKAIGYVQPRLLSITGATGAYLVKLVFSSIILIVATFFFLYDGPAMIKSVMYLSPLDDAYEQELLLEFDRISRAVVLATVLSAIVQGLTAGVGYYVAGMEMMVLLVMLTTIFAMVPFVGPAVIWVPVCLYLGLYEGKIFAACLLALWGVAVVGTIDNLVKAYVLHGQSQLHPLLALLSVLGGVQTLGPVGIVVGPMVVALLQTLLSILQRELMHFDKTRLVVSTEGTGERVKRRKPSASKELAEDPVEASMVGKSPEDEVAEGREVTEPSSSEEVLEDDAVDDNNDQ